MPTARTHASPPQYGKPVATLFGCQYPLPDDLKAPLLSGGDVTLAPVHSVEIRGVKGPPGTLAPTCCGGRLPPAGAAAPPPVAEVVPSGPALRVGVTPWGKVVQNSTGLCVDHHEAVTGHHAAILVEGDLHVGGEQ